MKNLLVEMVKALVDYPEQIRVNEVDGMQTTMLELSVAKRDIGKVLGRQGRNAQAIRTILNSVSGKMGKQVVLQIVYCSVVQKKFMASMLGMRKYMKNCYKILVLWLWKKRICAM